MGLAGSKRSLEVNISLGVEIMLSKTWENARPNALSDICTMAHWQCASSILNTLSEMFWRFEISEEVLLFAER